MSIALKVRRALREQAKVVRGNESYEAAQALRRKAAKLGVVLDARYTIPPLDTVGRRAYEAVCQTDLGQETRGWRPSDPSKS